MSNNKPMAGIKILELSSVVTAALAATLLSEQGAQTVKIEPLGIGDTLRHLGTARAGVSALFANCNRGKRSVALDLKREEGVGIVRKLAQEADVLISNYRPGVLERLGLGSELLRELNPRLVYVAISGFGTTGPLAAAPAYDHVIQAMSGFSDMQGHGDELDMVKTFVCDEVTAYTACQATTAALFARCSSGQGQHIDLSMLDAALYFLWPAGMGDHTFQGESIDRRPPLKLTYRTYPVADGYITMAPFTDSHWHGLFTATGNVELIEDQRFATMAGRATHMGDLFEKFEHAFTEMSAGDVERLLSGLDIPGSICLTVDQAIEHPQVRAVGGVQTQQHPELGQLLSPAHPARFGAQRLEPHLPLGKLGEHTREVLTELGYADEEVDGLAERGVISTG